MSSSFRISATLKEKGVSRFALVLMLSTVFLGGLAADDAQDIIRTIDAMNASETMQVKMSMLIYPDADDDDYRDFKLISYGKGEDESYMEFVAPRTIKGLSILSLDGDQWVYFPSTGRVRKIGGRSKGRSVQGVGGDFSYEDLGGGTYEESYAFSIESSDGSGWVLRGIPRKDDSSYTYIQLHVLKQDYRVTKTDFFDEDGLMKTLYQAEYSELGGRMTATEMTMLNHREESKTVVILHEAVYDRTIDDKYFTPSRFYK